MCHRPVNGDSCFVLPIGILHDPRPAEAASLASRRGWRSRLPSPVPECLPWVTTGLLLLLPQLEELTFLPAPLVFRRPLAHHVLVLARLDHLTGDLSTENLIMALAASRPVMVHQFVAA